MQKQFEKSQYVCYGANGICLIEDICPMPGMDGHALFYVLKPIADRNSVYYIPTDNESLVSKLRVPLTREEIDATIDSVKDASVHWIDDRSTRHEQCRAALRECDMRQVLLIVGMLYLQKQKLSEENKRLSTTDESLLRDAEKLTENEFSFVLGLNAGEIGPYIRRRLGLE